MKKFNDKDYILNLLKNAGAVLNDEEVLYILTSGRLSPMYIQCAKLHENPILFMEIMQLYTDKLQDHFGINKIDCIASPAIGAILPGYQVACNLNCEQFIFCEKNPAKDNAFEIRRGFEVKENKNYFIIEDVITTGGSFAKLANLVIDRGGKIAGFGSIIDRTNGFSRDIADQYSCEYVSLIDLNIPNYSHDEIPECMKSRKTIKPGISISNICNIS